MLSLRTNFIKDNISNKFHNWKIEATFNNVCNEIIDVEATFFKVHLSMLHQHLWVVATFFNVAFLSFISNFVKVEWIVINLQIPSKAIDNLNNKMLYISIWRTFLNRINIELCWPTLNNVAATCLKVDQYLSMLTQHLFILYQHFFMLIPC